MLGEIIVTVREVLKILYSDGWKECGVSGSHIQLENDSKPGKVTVPNHKGDIPKGTLNSIFKQAGMK